MKENNKDYNHDSSTKFKLSLNLVNTLFTDEEVDNIIELITYDQTRSLASRLIESKLKNYVFFANNRYYLYRKFTEHPFIRIGKSIELFVSYFYVSVDVINNDKVMTIHLSKETLKTSIVNY